MSVRTFTVFQDTPALETHKPRATSHPETPSSSSSIPPATSLASLTEKENLHPLTGEHNAPNASKKRKTAVLTTKIHMPLTTKMQKDESANSKHESKKRKSASSSSVKIKSTVKKDGKVSGSGRKTTSKRPSRKVSPLPKVEEESVVEKERVAQAHIDSRCYELTVQPLADLTPAYKQSPSMGDIISSEKAKLRFAKESSTEPEIRDYISHPLSSSAPSASKPPCTSSEIKSFSTPERKQIYASFTFSTPSPSGKRFSATRACTGDKSRSPSLSP